MRTDHCKSQGRAKQLRQVPRHTGIREGVYPLRHRRQRTRTPQKAVHQLLQRHHSHDDPELTREDSDKDDDIAKVRLQNRGLQEAMSWDPTMSITAYFTGLDKFQISLVDRGISTSVEEKAMAAGARMWESEMFTEDQMVAWENKPAVDQNKSKKAKKRWTCNLWPEHTKRKRQAPVTVFIESARRKLRTHDVSWLERHQTTPLHETPSLGMVLDHL